MTTYNGKALAAVVGCSRSTVQAAKNCGFHFLYGRTTTERSWWEFLSQNPGFKTRQGFLKANLRRPDLSRARTTAPRRPKKERVPSPEPCGKPDAP